MLTLINAYDPVTFTGPDDREGTVHRYAEGRSYVTACGTRLAADHGVVSNASTKPLCEGCWD
jgi:hypothetical protein